jgi:hypothetical protein
MWRHGTVAVVLMMLGLIGVALVVLVRLRGRRMHYDRLR